MHKISHAIAVDEGIKGALLGLYYSTNGGNNWAQAPCDDESSAVIRTLKSLGMLETRDWAVNLTEAGILAVLNRLKVAA